MQDDTDAPFQFDLTGIDPEGWFEEIAALGDEQGFYEDLGDGHAAAFMENGNTLLVSFESVAQARKTGPRAMPVGFEMTRDSRWSSLALISRGESRFDDPLVWGFFDRLIDEGFFASFDAVVFYGAGHAGYAAACYSAAAPGARVLAVKPQTPVQGDPDTWAEGLAKWRQGSLGGRYAYAPDLLDAADAAFVVVDPRERDDAAQAALLTGPTVTHLRAPSLGRSLAQNLSRMDVLHALIESVADGSLDEIGFARMMRARRENAGYLLRLLAEAEDRGHRALAMAICRHAAPRVQVPRFRRRLRHYQRMEIDRPGPAPAEA